MDGLEYNNNIIKAISLFVRDFHLYCTIVAPRDIELMHLVTFKCINPLLLAISYIDNLKRNMFMDELTIFIPFRLSVEIDVVSRIIVFEHYAFEANTWIATPLFTILHLSGNPVHTSFIFIALEVSFLDWFTQCYSSVVFSHLLGQFVN